MPAWQDTRSNQPSAALDYYSVVIFFPATQVVPVDLWILRCSRGAAKGDPKILNLPVTGCAFLSPPSSSVPGKRGDSQPCSVPAEAGGALASGDPAVSHSARTLSVPRPGYFWAQ